MKNDINMTLRDIQQSARRLSFDNFNKEKAAVSDIPEDLAEYRLLKAFSSYLFQLSNKTADSFMRFSNYKADGTIDPGFTDDLEDILKMSLRVFGSAASLYDNKIILKSSPVDDHKMMLEGGSPLIDLFPIHEEVTKSGLSCVIYEGIMPHIRDYHTTGKKIFQQAFELSYRDNIIIRSSDERVSKVYLSCESHYDHIKHPQGIRDVDNYDYKQFTDLVTESHVFGSDTGNNVRRIYMEIADTKDYSAVVIIPQDKVCEYLESVQKI